MKSTGNKKTTMFHRVIDTISGIFLPIINVMMAAALLKGLLLLGTNLEVLSETSGVYRILYAISDGFFHYLPIFLAYTASRKLKADTVTSMLLAAALVYPDITELFAGGMSMEFFGITVNPVSYPSSVIPIILAVGVLHYVEIPLEKYIHGTIKGFLKPMIALIIVTPITFLVFGPLGAFVGTGLSATYSAIYSFSPIVAGAVFGLIWQPMVVFGFHWGMVPVIIEHINTIGVDSFLPLCGAAVMGQAGAAMAVSIRAKNKRLKTVALSGAITAILGVTEPVLYGVNIPLKRPMIAACIAGAIGGAIVGTSDAGAVAFAYPSMLSLVVYLGDGFWTFFFSMIAGFVISLILGLLLGFNEADFKTEEL
jgi:PTS system beta-glucosides-specific IIC component